MPMFLTFVAAPAVFVATLSGPQALPGACSLLTKELALKVTSVANKQVFDSVPAEEEKLTPNGTSCEYGDIRIQLRAVTRQGLGAEYVAVPNLGDQAWFRANRNRYAELTVTVGTRTLDIQMAVPSGGTVDAVRPKAIQLATELLPKLR